MTTQKIKVEKNQKIIDLIDKNDKTKYICAKVNGIVRSLNYTFKDNSEVIIEFLDLTSSEACKIYQASLRFLTSLAIASLDEKLDVRFYYYISRCTYGKFISKKKNVSFSYDFIKKIELRMKEIVNEDIIFSRKRFSKDEAIKIYKENSQNDKVQVLKYRKENYVHLYQANFNGFKYFDYLYEELVPSSGYLNLFEIRPYAPGFLINSPRAEFNGNIPPYKDEPKFAKALSFNSFFAEENELDTAVSVNKFLHKYSDVGLINVSEAKINRQLVKVTDEIISSSKPIRLVCIAGPSSSGKTSFANRLMYELMSFGKKPIRISIDNFYFPKNKMIPGTDIESLDAIDVELFNETISNLIIGEEVYLPKYDFKTNIRTMEEKISIDDDQIIIIEGIHALNSKLTNSIPEDSKYRIYISPQPQVSIDNHTPLSMSNLRLLRRIARDSRTRGTEAKETIKMWANVRNGEFKYIYPTQENADFVFDSFYFYEPCALRNIVLPQLDKILPTDNEYTIASDLKQVVKYFLPMDSKFVPCNSLMREFIGGTCFKDAR